MEQEQIESRCALIEQASLELPGQAVAARIELARLLYPVFVHSQHSKLREAIRKTLPFRWWKERRVEWTRLEGYYKQRLPETVIEKYLSAKQTQLFDAFWVAEPTYAGLESLKDPWLVGVILSSISHDHPDQSAATAIIARWE